MELVKRGADAPVPVLLVAVWYVVLEGIPPEA